MSYFKIRQRNKNKEKIEIVKVRLKYYRENLKLIDSLKSDIKDIEDSFNSIHSGWSDTDPTNGGSSFQEDILVKSIDDIDFLEKGIESIKKDNEEIRKAIKNLNDNLSETIVYKLWVYDKYSDKHDTIRGLARKYDVSKDMVWRKSDAALLSIYKSLYNY
ncbi:MAG: hypothetical protein E6427_00040 [Anaerococcus sp.]|nr:hypothetical protein [Anaerococcus sp.]